MAYFHCLIGGGSSGGGYELTVTCDADFAGTTITCTDGVTTLTQTCPSASPYEVVFEIPNGGEWTISGVYQGDTISTQISIPDEVSLEISHVPNGSTVTPTDDIQIWLACAEITDKSYTTLAEVLADRETFETLIADSNACDYMARSTSWAVALGAVPTLVTASSNVISSGDYSGQPAWKVFDGDNSTPWSADAPYLSGGAYIGYKFDMAKNINNLGYIKRYESASSTQVWKVQGSSDGTNWIDLSDNFTVITAVDNDKSWHYINFTNANSYSYYRVYEISNNNNSLNPSFMELQFYETDITRNPDAMSLIGKYDYCSNALLSNATWCTAIGNSDYFESILNVSVPKMTSNTAPSGTVIGASTVWNNMYLWYAFDGNDSTYASPSSDAYIGYEFTEPVKVLKLDILLGETGVAGSNGFILEKYVNNNWVQILDESNITTNAHNQYSFANSDATTKYRITLKQSQVAQCATSIQFYGRASSNVSNTNGIIHTANGDTVTCGGNTYVADTNGIVEIDFSDFDEGTYTFTSGIAKDPTNLSNYYSKSFKITKSPYGGTTEMYLMPDTVKTLYWWGYFDSNCEPCTSANGWGGNVDAPTINTNSVTLNPSTNRVKGIGTKSSISPTKLYNISKANASGSSVQMGVNTSKNVTLSQITQNTSTSMSYVEGNVTSGTYYVTTKCENNQSGELYALWYE